MISCIQTRVHIRMVQGWENVGRQSRRGWISSCVSVMKSCLKKVEVELGPLHSFPVLLLRVTGSSLLLGVDVQILLGLETITKFSLLASV